MTRIARIERKTEYFPIVGEMKATNDTKYQMEGYLNFIGNIDFGDDRTMPGAFKNTLRDSYSRKSAQGLDFLWPYLWNHDYNILPPGGIYEANEDKKGLFIKVQFNPDIQLGRELYASYKMGTMKKNSMGYKCIRADYVKDAGRTIRNLLEVAIMEGSGVIFPMNDLADTTSVKRTFSMPGTQKIKQKPSDDPYYLDLEKYLSRKLQPVQGQPLARKDFNESYLQRQQQDWLDDLWNIWYALKSEIISAFQMGDQPIEDTRAALDQFSQAMLAYVQQGVDLGMVEALQPDDDDDCNGGYGWMSDQPGQETKEGRTLSAANHTTMTKAVQGIMGHCDDLNKMLTAAKPNKGASTTPLAGDAQHEDGAVSTHLNELLHSIEIANLKRQLNTK